MGENGVRSLLVTCSNVTCRHEKIVNVDAYGDDLFVPSFGPSPIPPAAVAGGPRSISSRKGKCAGDVKSHGVNRRPAGVAGERLTSLSCGALRKMHEKNRFLVGSED